jgi:hypothetical protein
MCRGRRRAHAGVMHPNDSTHTAGSRPALPIRLHRVPAAQAPWPVRIVGSEILVPSWFTGKASAARALHSS